MFVMVNKNKWLAKSHGGDNKPLSIENAITRSCYWLALEMIIIQYQLTVCGDQWILDTKKLLLQ